MTVNIVPTTKAARHAQIVALIATTPVRSQMELAELLAVGGISVTQATLSRDLVELRALKVRTVHGEMVYTVPEEGDRPDPQAGDPGLALRRLSRLCADLLITAEASGPVVVLRTPPGAAQFLASAIDRTVVPGVLGTVAGDDTVMVIARQPVDESAGAGAALAAQFLALASDSKAQSTPTDDEGS